MPFDIDPDLLRTRTDHGNGWNSETAPDGPVLVVVLHPDPRYEGVRLGLDDGDVVIVGRGSGVLGPGTLDDPLISREHARISRVGDEVRLDDLESHNGTWLDGHQVDSVVVEPGGVIGVGNLLLVVVHGPDSIGIGAPEGMLGFSGGLARVQEQLEVVAARDVPVLIRGETGTGKEHVASALHEQSGRTGELVRVNCGAVADSLLHSELFGHVGGAFSGARGPREGLVVRARHGTLFLDEIGDASPDLQASLLRLLESGEYRAVGSDRARISDARFVAATHVDLAEAVEAGRFREDLFSRLTRWVISIPPLRERPEDILVLARHFAEQLAGRPLQVERTLALALLRHPWPRNVRELRSAVERAVLESPGDELRLSAHLDELLTPRTPPPAPRKERAVRPDAEGLREALLAHGGNVRKLAQHLGVGRSTLYRWLRDAEIDPDDLR